MLLEIEVILLAHADRYISEAEVTTIKAEAKKILALLINDEFVPKKYYELH